MVINVHGGTNISKNGNGGGNKTIVTRITLRGASEMHIYYGGCIGSVNHCFTVLSLMGASCDVW